MQIQVVVTYRKDFLGILMRWWGLRWSHAALRFREFSRDDWEVYETAAFGTVKTTWAKFIKGVDSYKCYKTTIDLEEMDQEKILSFCEGALGKFYNVPALLWIALEYLIGKRKAQALAIRAYVCSSFVAAVFEHIYIDLVPGFNNIWIVPDDLADSKLLEEVEP